MDLMVWIIGALSLVLFGGAGGWVAGLVIVAGAADLIVQSVAPEFGLFGRLYTAVLIIGAPLAAVILVHWTCSAHGESGVTVERGLFRTALPGLAGSIAVLALLQSGAVLQAVGGLGKISGSGIAEPVTFFIASISAVCSVASISAATVLLVLALAELPLRWLTSALRQRTLVPWTALRTLAAVAVLSISINTILELFVAELSPLRLLERV